MFINFSNHPSSKWSSKQTEAAQLYGEIKDLTFPVVDEAATTEDIKKLAQEYLKKISEIAPDVNNTTIHIMGEMTFTLAMVVALKSEGYSCVASTSKRIVEEMPDGSKNVKFEFCQFREY